MINEIAVISPNQVFVIKWTDGSSYTAETVKNGEPFTAVHEEPHLAMDECQKKILERFPPEEDPNENDIPF